MKIPTIIGSTGLIGVQVSDLLEKNQQVEKYYFISRTKPLDLKKKGNHIAFDDGKYTLPDDSDAAICCLGTTMKKAGSKSAFQKVDLEMVIDFAQRAKNAGVKRFAVVSSIGANPKSGNFYLRTKGEMEEQLKAIGFERLVIVRPSLLLGNRIEKRLGEDIGKILYNVFRFLFIGPLSKYRGVQAVDVAKAMIVLVSKGQGTVIAESNVLKMFSNEHELKC
jgi:uncharacterized protein YbjT (DUF2867 family)